MLKKTNFSLRKSIKNNIEKELKLYLCRADKAYSLSKTSPLIFSHIKNFLTRPSKRIRPSLFITGYLGFSNKPAPGLYTSALSIELLHNFILVHDDIIDKSDIRRGKLSMHSMFNAHLAKYKYIKYKGQDLAIILGDIMYAMGIAAFLTIDENAKRKEKALKKLIDAAISTGEGEFLELLSEIKKINTIKKEGIYRIYDLKTAIYSFATPLMLGAMLTGAKKDELNKLFRCGIYLGRAFQIKDDISDILGSDWNSDKSGLTDLRESKITILIWYAYNNSKKDKQLIIKRILEKNEVTRYDLLRARKIIINSRAISYARTEITALVNRAKTFCAASKMHSIYKDLLINHCNELLQGGSVT